MDDAPRHDDDAGQGDAARAFEDLRAEMSVLRRAVEALPTAWTDNQPPDYTPDLARLNQGLASVTSGLAAIEKHPALRFTPDQHHAAVARAGATLMREASQKLDQATQETERERRLAQQQSSIVALTAERDEILLAEGIEAVNHDDIEIAVEAGVLKAVVEQEHIGIRELAQQDLAVRLHQDNDLDAARQLILPHLRFVVSVARKYSGYGLALGDLIQEGNIGLMKAVKRFDPGVGVRLVTFAMHWIKAEIHEYVLRNWRIVKVATTKAQRKLFFNCF